MNRLVSTLILHLSNVRYITNIMSYNIKHEGVKAMEPEVYGLIVEMVSSNNWSKIPQILQFWVN